MRPRRLAYDPSALRRRMLMTKTASLLVIVEGTETDRWYYDQLCQRTLRAKHRRWLIWPVDQLTRNLGAGEQRGKSAVIELFKHARKNGYLTTRSRTHKVSLLFCVDSDFDRIIGGRFRSPHLRYTRLPDVEADVLSQCILPDAVASLLSLPSEDAVALIGKIGHIQKHSERFTALWFYCTAFLKRASRVTALDYRVSMTHEIFPLLE